VSLRRLALPLALLPAIAGCAASRSPGLPPAPPAERPDSRETRQVVPGVTLERSRDARGPWAIHIVRIDLDSCRPVLRAAKAGPPLSARATASALGSGALAAINADFFELPGGSTVGAHVSGGVVVAGPAARPVFAWTDRGPAQGQARIEGWVAAGPDTTVVLQVNRRADPARTGTGVRLLTEGAAPDSAGPALRVGALAGDMRRGRGVVSGRSEPPAVAGPGEVLFTDGAWTGRRAVGDTVEWDIRLEVEGSAGTVREAVGGYPTLIRNGRPVLEGQAGIRPEFGARRHPRTAVGWSARSLIWIVVDGRQGPWSDGMTLAELADLFLRLGAREAINLDGGGSSAMVIRGQVINRPSDAAGERAVGNALLLDRCEPQSP
jgi:hypothetical protein